MNKQEHHSNNKRLVKEEEKRVIEFLASLGSGKSIYQIQSEEAELEAQEAQE